MLAKYDNLKEIIYFFIKVIKYNIFIQLKFFLLLLCDTQTLNFRFLLKSSICEIEYGSIIHAVFGLKMYREYKTQQCRRIVHLNNTEKENLN